MLGTASLVSEVELELEGDSGENNGDGDDARALHGEQIIARNTTAK